MWARVVARSNADLQRVIDQVLSHEGIDRSTTVIALATQIPYRMLPLVRSMPLVEEGTAGRGRRASPVTRPGEETTARHRVSRRA